MKVFYLGVDVSKKKLDLCLRSNGKDILYDVIPNDLSSIKSWLTRTFEKFSSLRTVWLSVRNIQGNIPILGLCNKKYRSLLMFGRCS